MDSTKNNDDMIQQYIESLTTIELKALDIAKTQLLSSFSIEKSIGFIEWNFIVFTNKSRLIRFIGNGIKCRQNAYKM